MLFKKVPAAAGCFQYQYTTEKRPCTAGVCGADRRPSRMVVLSDLHNSEFGAYNSELVDKVRRRWPAFTCASRWAMWKPDCVPTIWIPPIRRSSTGRRWACWQIQLRAHRAGQAEPAAEVVQLVGGTENISSVAHCMIRLRFAVKDLNKADQEALKKIPSVLSVTPAA